MSIKIQEPGFHDTDPMRPARDSEATGEGNREADRQYREGVTETLETKDVNALADEAKRALEGPEGAALRAAEKKAKAGPFPKKKKK